LKPLRSEGGAEESSWLYTYGDIMTLVLSFFVLLFAISSMDKYLYEDILISLKESLGTGKGSPAADERIVPDITKALELRGVAHNVTVETERNEVRVYGADSIFFERGSADIHPTSALFLKEIATVLAQVRHRIRVEGHTDDEPSEGGDAASNWELSTARAVSVVYFLMEQGIDPRRLSAEGFGQYAPRYPPSPQNRARNRRVEIVIETR